MNKYQSEIIWTESEVKLKDLKPYEKNPRKIGKEQFERLVKSLKEDGYHDRILMNLDNTIIGGHQRKKALKELGYKDNDLVKVLIPNKLLEGKEFERVNIRDNGHFGDWDMDILANAGWEIEEYIDAGVPETLFSSIIGNWESDIDPIKKAGETLQGIEGKIIIKCNPEDKEDIKAFITDQLKQKGYIGYEVI